MVNPSKNVGTKREEWIDLAKVITMILVVIGHSAYYHINSHYGNINVVEGAKRGFSTDIIQFLVSFIYSFHMPFFMALSGITYAISRNPSTFSTFINKKVKRLLLPFILTTLFLSIPIKYMSGYWTASENIFKDIFLGQILLFGNSHLWFIVSLFEITIVFRFLSYRNSINLNRIFPWIILVILSYMGIYFETKGAFLGIPGALKNALFFILGYRFYEKCKTIYFKIGYVILGWIVMIFLFGVICYTNIFIPKIRVITYVPMALFGCLNMVVTTKLLIKDSILSHSLYRSLSKYSYDIYLYSDCLNYLLIVVLVDLMGEGVVSDDFKSVLAFFIRIVVTILFSYLVIFFIQKFAKPVVGWIVKKY